MPTSDTEIRDVVRHVFEKMVDDSPLSPEWAELAVPTPRSVNERRSPSGLFAAMAAAVLVLVAVGGALWLVRTSSSTVGPGPIAESPAPMVARVTVVFSPGELTDAQLDEFGDVVANYGPATGVEFFDEATAHKQARDHAAGDRDTLAVLDQRPDVAASYAQVAFTDRDEAPVFQEQVGGLDFVVVAVGSNGPRLGGGYGDLPAMSVEQDDVRGAVWQFFYNLDLPEQIRSNESETSASDLPVGEGASVATTVAVPSELIQEGVDLQNEILADGIVTLQELEQAVAAMAECMQSRGLNDVTWSVDPDGSGFSSGYTVAFGDTEDAAIATLCQYSYIEQLFP